MSPTSPKSGTPPKDDLSRWEALRRLVIVGAATLKGKELKDVLQERNFPALDIKLLDDDESLGQLDAVGEEPTFIQSVRPEHFDRVDFTFFASEADFTRRHWQKAHDAGSVVIDLSHGLEDEPSAVVRSPWLEAEHGGGESAGARSKLQIVAHPASVVLGLLILRAQRAAPIRSVTATVFEPASEQGRRGMDELHQQTVNLLSFQEMPKTVFDAQVAFNLLSRYGTEALPTLESVETRILKQFAAIAGAGVPVPSRMLLQGPTFHSHTFSIYIDLEREHSTGDFARVLTGEHVSLSRLAEDAPNNVSAAGQNEILVALRRDPQRPSAFWLWAAADNLKMAAINAVECAETSTAPLPKERIQ
jgi:aspartate-semialdehyde dehydrogenase